MLKQVKSPVFIYLSLNVMLADVRLVNKLY